MSVNDPHVTHEHDVRRTREPDPAVIRTRVVRDNSAGWWVAALVAIVPIIAVVFMVTRPPADTRTDAEIATALEQARAQAAFENAQATMAQNAESARLAAEAAAARAAAATAEANARAEAAARQAAESAAAATETVTDALPVTPEVEPR